MFNLREILQYAWVDFKSEILAAIDYLIILIIITVRIELMKNSLSK